MVIHYLDFEKPLVELEREIEDLLNIRYEKFRKIGTFINIAPENPVLRTGMKGALPEAEKTLTRC